MTTSTTLPHDSDRVALRDAAAPVRTGGRDGWFVVHATLIATWALMIVGAATRAARAGIACPDWPLCHGRFIPPLDAHAYPANPNYLVYRVYLEFGHRVAAATVSAFAIAVGVRAIGLGMRGRAIALWAVLFAQVLMGAVTVWLRNAPFTVVIHLGLAMSFVAVTLSIRQPVAEARAATGSQPVSPAVRNGFRWILAGLVVQMLLGAVVSSKLIGLACFDFPTCNGRLLPPIWTLPIAWQMAHRVMGLVVVTGAVCFAVAVIVGRRPSHERRLAAWIAALGLAQALLGGVAVWLQIPPAVSAAHLGLATALFALAVSGALRRTDGSTPASPASPSARNGLS